MPARLRFGATVLGGLLLAWTLGLVWFAETTPREAPGSDRRTDAIVVLTGGSERLATGIELLAAGRADRLFVSGVNQGVDIAELLRAARPPAPDLPVKVAAAGLNCRIVLGYRAGNTVGNATETAAWMRDQHLHSLRLVTSNYHMRRSLLEFRMALPEVEVVPHPVAPVSVRLDRWWRWPGTASLLVTEYDKFLLTALRYWLAGDFPGE